MVTYKMTFNEFFFIMKRWHSIEYKFTCHWITSDLISTEFLLTQHVFSASAVSLLWLRVLFDLVPLFSCHNMGVWSAIMTLIRVCFYFELFDLLSSMCSSPLRPCPRHRSSLNSCHFPFKLSFRKSAHTCTHIHSHCSNLSPFHFKHYQIVSTFLTLFQTIIRCIELPILFGLFVRCLHHKRDRAVSVPQPARANNISKKHMNQIAFVTQSRQLMSHLVLYTPHLNKTNKKTKTEQK